MSISEKCNFLTKITTNVKLPFTTQIKYVVIFVANRTGDPRNRICEKYSPRCNLQMRVSGPYLPNTVELIPTLGAPFPRGGPVQDADLT